MKHINQFFSVLGTIFLLVFSINAFSQGTTCATADPFCTIDNYTFPNTTGTSSEAGNNYDCLGTQPNPAWYYMEIATAGPITIGISQVSGSGVGIDVDFILYGPYANLTAATADCGNMGIPGGEVVDCSYSPSPTETANLPNGQVGEVYMMLLTNFSNSAGDISFSQTGGTGATDCSIVFPPSCGTVDFHAETNTSPYPTINPFPSTMSCEDDWIYLTANDSATAGGYITPSLHFELNPLPDANDNVTIYSGGTGALGSGTSLGTFNLLDASVLTLYGEYLSPSTNYYMEICDETSVDWIVYDGGLGTIYNSGTDVSGNGCTRFGPFSPAGSATWVSSAPPASVGASDVGYMWFDPAVAGPGSYNFDYTWNNGAGCNNTATHSITVTNPYSFTSLTYATVCKSAGGTVSPSITATGGGTYSSGTLGGSLNSTTGVVNIATAPIGVHTVTYLVGTMPCGATGNSTITISPDVTPTFTQVNPICSGVALAALPTTSTNGITGTWTPAINNTATTLYTFNPNPGQCATSATMTITVNPSPTADSPSNVTACDGYSLPALTVGDYFTTTGGVGPLAVGTNITSNQTIYVYAETGSIPNCTDENSFTVTINPTPVAGSPTNVTTCDSYTLPPLGTGNYFTATNGGGTALFAGNTITAAGVNTIYVYAETGTTPNCTDENSFTVTITTAPVAGVDNTLTACNNDGTTDLYTLLGVADLGGTWVPAMTSGTGVYDPATDAAGTYQYIVTGTSPCVDDTSEVVVTLIPAPNAGTDNTLGICATGTPIDLYSLLGVADLGGTWSPVLTSGTGVFDPATDAGGTYQYIVAGTLPCADDTSEVVVTITANDDPTFTYPDFCTGSGGTPGVINTPGGTFSYNPDPLDGSIINAGTGVITNGVGGSTYNIQYLTPSGPCQDSVTITVNVESPVNAGADSTLSTCATGAPTDLYTLLGVADVGGTWVPAMTSGTGVFDPATDAGGAYQYIVSGVSPCSDDTSEVVVTITANDDPTFTYPDFCSGSGGIVGIINTPGGTFSYNPDPLDGSIINAGTGVITNGVGGSTYSIQYLTPTGPCQDSVTITVNVGTPVNAGTNNTLTACSADGTTDLYTLLGTADLGGTWTPVMMSGTGVFDPSVDAGGVYTYLVNGTAPCGDDSAIIIITIDPQLTITTVPDTITCEGVSLTLIATGSGNGTVTWYSDLAGTNVLGTGNTYSPPVGTIGSITYYVNEAGTCPSVMESFTVVVGGVVANINANPLTGAIPLNVSLDGTGSIGSVVLWQWDFGDGNTGTGSSTSNTYTGIGIYDIELIVSDGICWDTTSVTIDAFGESSILIPNVFTPNGDGSNDIFAVEGVNLESVEGEIYNRWGQKMFSWTNVKGHWDGRTLAGAPAPDGTYFYMIKAVGFDGEEYFKKGGFSLVR